MAAWAGGPNEVQVRVSDPAAAAVAPDPPRWELKPVGAPERSPLPWVVAGIGASLAVIGAGTAAPGWDPEDPFAAPGARTAVAGTSVGLGGLVWGLVREAARPGR